MTSKQLGAGIALAVLITSMNTASLYARDGISLTGSSHAIVNVGGQTNTNQDGTQTQTKTNLEVRTIGYEGQDDRYKDWSFNGGIAGKVVATSTNFITIQQMGSGDAKYTVDTTNATYRKGDTVLNSSTIAVGQIVVVQGVANGSTIVANSIIETKAGASIPAVKGQGVFGTVIAINGSTLTVTGKNNVTYTVNAANAKVWKNHVEGKASLSSIAVGDTVIAQGTVNGTNVTATSVATVSLGNYEKGNDDQGEVKNEDKGGERRGFFHRIGVFFKSFFGINNK